MGKNVHNKKKENNLSKIYSNRLGFSMVEVLVSLSVVVISLLVILQLSVHGVQDSMDSRDQLVATGLAQEGTELVRNIRDSNWRASAASFATITTGVKCTIDKDYSVDTNPIMCNSGRSDQLYLDASGFFVHSETIGSVSTKFHRKLDISSNGTSMTVTTMVGWGSVSLNDFSPANCNITTKCLYKEATLSDWGAAN